MQLVMTLKELNGNKEVYLLVFNDCIMCAEKIMEKKKETLNILFLLENQNFDGISAVPNEDSTFKVSIKEDEIRIHEYIFKTKTKEDAESLMDKLIVRIPKRQEERKKKRSFTQKVTSMLSFLKKSN